MAKRSFPPVIVVYGEEHFQKCESLTRFLDLLLPPEIDRGMALAEYDGARAEDQGGPAFATVADDLNTLPFLADRRVVVVREADAFISRYREQLERYVHSPSASGALVLECRTFPKTTRLHKAVAAAGGVIEECRKLQPRDAVDFIMGQARRFQKKIDAAAAARLTDLIGADAGLLAGEVEKLAMFVGARPTIADADVTALVGQSREERIFAVIDAALLGNVPEALRLWEQVLSSDRAAAYKAIGGMAFVIRRLLGAHRMAAEGMPLGAIAPKVMMFRREQDLSRQLRRMPPARLEKLLADMAEMDMKSKTGIRSVETGIEELLVSMRDPR